MTGKRHMDISQTALNIGGVADSGAAKTQHKAFKIHSRYQPAGDQPKAIAQLVAGIGDGEVHQTLLGVTGSGKTFTIANVIERTQRPAMVLAPNKTLAAQLYGEMKEFFPDNSVEYFVSYYDYYQPEAYIPASDTFIDKDASLNQHIEQMRLSATKALLERRDTVGVATVSAIYGLGEPESYFQMVLHLVRGDIIKQRDILRRLAEMQYTRNDTNCAGRLTACAAMSSTYSRQNRKNKPCALSYSTTKSSGWPCSTR